MLIDRRILYKSWMLYYTSWIRNSDGFLCFYVHYGCFFHFLSRFSIYVIYKKRLAKEITATFDGFVDIYYIHHSIWMHLIEFTTWTFCYKKIWTIEITNLFDLWWKTEREHDHSSQFTLFQSLDKVTCGVEVWDTRFYSTSRHNLDQNI